jgi:hypothetical protein
LESDKRESNFKLYVSSTAVMLCFTIIGDDLTQQFCGAVLSSLSFYESCRVTLCERGMISALKNLSTLADDVTKQRCLVAFANLSCEVSIQVSEVCY